MTETDPLVKALLRERYGCNHWWAKPVPDQDRDDDVTTARRRRELVAEAGAARDAETA